MNPVSCMNNRVSIRSRPCEYPFFVVVKFVRSSDFSRLGFYANPFNYSANKRCQGAGSFKVVGVRKSATVALATRAIWSWRTCCSRFMFPNSPLLPLPLLPATRIGATHKPSHMLSRTHSEFEPPLLSDARNSEI